MRSNPAWQLCLLALLPCVHAQDLKRRPQGPAAIDKAQPVLGVPHTLALAKSPNADGVYQQLRAMRPNGNSFHVHELKLERDAGVFTFHDGSFYLMPSIAGRVTGAVFIARGTSRLSRRQRPSATS